MLTIQTMRDKQLNRMIAGLSGKDLIYEIQPSRISEQDTIIACEPENATFWSVYSSYADEGKYLRKFFKDFPTQADALECINGFNN